MKQYKVSLSLAWIGWVAMAIAVCALCLDIFMHKTSEAFFNAWVVAFWIVLGLVGNADKMPNSRNEGIGGA